MPVNKVGGEHALSIRAWALLPHADTFRPAPGPRQIPQEANADPRRSPRKILITASFLTEASVLERHIPERFSLLSEPVVTVEFHYMTDIDWLAGRGYTMIHVWWPVVFSGDEGRVVGRFLAVMWENLADPIITGRGEIGQPKLFADIPDLRTVDGTHHCEASWMGFKFLELDVTQAVQSASRSMPGQHLEGTLMFSVCLEPACGARLRCVRSASRRQRRPTSLLKCASRRRAM
jgi:hypothetical protein